MFVIKYKKIFFTFSALLVALSLLFVALFGLNLGIDFTGGSILEVSYPEERADFAEVRSAIDQMDIGAYTLQTIGDDGYIARTRFLTEEERLSLLQALSVSGQYEVMEERFNSIGPTIGSELRSKALVAILIVVVAIILFVAWAFRQVSEPVSSWKYGLSAIVALVHDIAIPVGLVAILGQVLGLEVDVLFVMALLAILGFSVNDTIVVFDRVRENLRLNKENKEKESFEETVGRSLNQTFVRSINTSLTTLFVVFMLFLIGGEVTRDFALILLVGILVGTYSSIFLASPLLVLMERIQKKTN